MACYKKRKYQEDPKYREKVQKHNREVSRLKSEERQAKRAQVLVMEALKEIQEKSAH